ncbi:jg15905 [Pararge aegeria aegeria]|uniref:Jg15905 protein n=1 Tax=Pararge aegeria aegeria TaxID=348720 RepID=A0A8S4S4T3_9NEOP|nr:jg15905 [Pararge aegeria aegeria]
MAIPKFVNLKLKLRGFHVSWARFSCRNKNGLGHSPPRWPSAYWWTAANNKINETNISNVLRALTATRLPMPAFSSRAVLMYSAAVGGEGVALQLREATPAEIDERLALACHEPELLADLLHAAADIVLNIYAEINISDIAGIA